MQASGRSKDQLEHGALSLSVVGAYLRKEVNPPIGRIYEIKYSGFIN